MDVHWSCWSWFVWGCVYIQRIANFCTWRSYLKSKASASNSVPKRGGVYICMSEHLALTLEAWVEIIELFEEIWVPTRQDSLSAGRLSRWHAYVGCSGLSGRITVCTKAQEVLVQSVKMWRSNVTLSVSPPSLKSWARRRVIWWAKNVSELIWWRNAFWQIYKFFLGHGCFLPGKMLLRAPKVFLNEATSAHCLSFRGCKTGKVKWR